MEPAELKLVSETSLRSQKGASGWLSKRRCQDQISKLGYGARKAETTDWNKHEQVENRWEVSGSSSQIGIFFFFF